jgi:hypothetical protein
MSKTIEELQAELDDANNAKAVLEANKQRIIEESTKFKTRAQEAESKLTAAETKKLEEQGDLQKLLDNERLETKNLKAKLNETTSTVLREKLRSQIGKVAKDAHDIDMVLKVTEHKALLKINEDTMEIEGETDFVNKVRETHAYLFSKKAMPETEVKKAADKDLDTKTGNEKYLEELKSVKNKKELYALKIKYGKPVDAYQKY